MTRHDFRETTGEAGGVIQDDPWGRRWIACARCGMKRVASAEQKPLAFDTDDCTAPVETLPCLN